MARPVISEETKKKMAELRDSAKSTAPPKLEDASSETAKDVPSALGKIYEYMVLKRELELQRRDYDKDQKLKEQKEQESFDNLIHDAIKGKEEEKEKKAKKAKKAKKKPKKKEGIFEKVAGAVGTTLKIGAGAAVVAASVAGTEKEEKAEAAKEAPPAPKAPPPTPTPPPKGAVEEAPVSTAGVPGMIATDLASKGVSSKGQANVLAQVKAESNFKPQSEQLNYKSAERIQQVFGPKRIPSLDFAQKLVNNPEGLANVVYAKTDGNSEPGDGYKYRGRGFLQHTGKNQYKAIAKFTGVDVVNNPDKLNDPKIASQAVAWFFLDYKKKKPEQLDDIGTVNKAVGFAGGEKEGNHRAQLAQSFASSGTMLASASVTNADAKEKMQKDVTTQVAKNNQTTMINQTQTAQAPQKVDDRPIWQQKATV